jgi:hypothetical protein
MTDEERRLGKLFVDAWKRAGAMMQPLRDADIRVADTASMINCTNRSFRQSIKDNPPQPTSGLVEQQRWFARQKPK